MLGLTPTWEKKKTLECGDDDSVFGDMTSTQALRPVCVWEAISKARQRRSCPRIRQTGRRNGTRQLQKPPLVRAPLARCSSPWWPRRCRWSGRRPPPASPGAANWDRCRCLGHIDRLSPAHRSWVNWVSSVNSLTKIMNMVKMVKMTIMFTRMMLTVCWLQTAPLCLELISYLQNFQNFLFSFSAKLLYIFFPIFKYLHIWKVECISQIVCHFYVSDFVCFKSNRQLVYFVSEFDFTFSFVDEYKGWVVIACLCHFFEFLNWLAFCVQWIISTLFNGRAGLVFFLVFHQYFGISQIYQNFTVHIYEYPD